MNDRIFLLCLIIHKNSQVGNIPMEIISREFNSTIYRNHFSNISCATRQQIVWPHYLYLYPTNKFWQRIEHLTDKGNCIFTFAGDRKTFILSVLAIMCWISQRIEIVLLNSLEFISGNISNLGIFGN